MAFIVYHRRFIENEMRRKLDKTEINDIVGGRGKVRKTLLLNLFQIAAMKVMPINTRVLRII